MIEIGIFQNGASDLPCVEVDVDGRPVTVTGGTLAQTHSAAQRTIVNQVRQGILADQLGYDYWFQTERHFQPEGAELSPNPLVSEAAIASRTKRIRLAQAANIICWWHPLRIAEQAAMLDVISGGRLEFGIGRGYQPRENETFGWTYGSTIQDQERNRAYYEEAYDTIIKAWTQDSFSHHGEFLSLPPSYTKWNHRQTIAYFSQPGVERSVEQVLKLGPPDMYSGGNPVQATTTKLLEIPVYPQPLQKPYPQMWEPLTSPRSIKWAAERGINGYFIVEPNSRLRRNIEMYYDAAEKAGWPDRKNRGRFKHGWDAEKRRGVVTCRYIHVAEKGLGDLDRAARGMELQWDYYGPFGFAAVLAEADEPVYDTDMKVTADLLRQKEVAIHGSKQYVIDTIMKVKDQCGYEDFMFNAWFEMAGFAGEEIEAQMQYFAEEIMPVLRKECGGSPQRQESSVDLDVGAPATPAEV
ncbi:F420-dependent methylene-tetrahydromethanopterin reductase [Mycobacterium lentiflavum]|uniref:F420-dependent methylene-tetrahydromethanopterin reductase n=1 Tax=Mycobacterium lentiflavum TaxID=141349 RepID=A0A0E3WE63_MYCLN|nr:LLM class flavin-dependent oxidoreductase [Mycobacterium lentiflavum]CQD23910.1 F420-dependent methylene-tetrahydromethanopterin reductase [Mycobacterium lentiflavum]